MTGRISEITLVLCLLFYASLPVSVNAENTLTVAVSANALRPIEEVSTAFEKIHPVKVRIVSGSTGKLFTQITQGAPFDIFLAADKKHPLLLEAKGLTIPGSRVAYASGVLVLWISKSDIDIDKEDKGISLLGDSRIKRIAIANPVTAPYGSAAIETLKASGMFKDVEHKLVYGESVSQAFSFARSGNADAAFVALSIIYGQEGKALIIDASLHSPIVQEAVVLKNAPPSAAQFMDFLASQEALAIFDKYGYRSTGNQDDVKDLL